MRRTPGALLLAAVARRLALVVAVALGVTAGVVLVVAAVPLRYDATVIVGFSPRSPDPVGGDVVSLLVPGYAAAATSREALDAASAGAGAPPGTLEASDVTAEVVPETATVALVVSDAEPARAAALADALADVLVVQTGAGLLEARVVRPAEAPPAPAAPARALYDVAGAVAGVGIALALVLALESARPRVRTAADLRSLLRVPTLATVGSGRSRRPGPIGPEELLLGRLRVDAAHEASPGGARSEAGGRTVAVLGVGRCDGSTTEAVARALAASFAAAGGDTGAAEDAPRDPATALAPRPDPSVRVVPVTGAASGPAVEAARSLRLVVAVVRRGESAEVVQRLGDDLRAVGADLVGGVLVR